MEVDLTRFDFHAKKFYFSENVQAMSAEEVGQYLLLMVAAWMGGKDASLPDNPALLARMARVSQVSEAVLAMFPVVQTEHGARRRNDTLHEEWLEALGRSLSCSENGKKGGVSRSEAKVLAARENGKKHTSVVVLSSNPSDDDETQAEPKPNLSECETSNSNQTNQLKPNQSNQTSACDGVSSSKSATTTDWKNIAIPHKRVFGSKASVMFKDKYYDACSKYGETVVLKCFEDWAPGAKDWVEANNVQHPLHSFFKKLPAEAEDAVEIQQAEQEQNLVAVEKKQREEQAQAASIARQNKEIQEQWAVKPQPAQEDPNDFFKE